MGASAICCTAGRTRRGVTGVADHDNGDATEAKAWEPGLHYARLLLHQGLAKVALRPLLKECALQGARQGLPQRLW